MRIRQKVSPSKSQSGFGGANIGIYCMCLLKPTNEQICQELFWDRVGNVLVAKSRRLVKISKSMIEANKIIDELSNILILAGKEKLVRRKCGRQLFCFWLCCTGLSSALWRWRASRCYGKAYAARTQSGILTSIILQIDKQLLSV